MFVIERKVDNPTMHWIKDIYIKIVFPLFQNIVLVSILGVEFQNFDQILSLMYIKNILMWDLVRFASMCTFTISTFIFY